MFREKRMTVLVICLLTVLHSVSAVHGQKLKALIVDGQNNHNMWPKTTIMMKHYLEESGRFDVEIERTQFVWNGQLAEKFPLNDGQDYENLSQPKPDPNFKPNFSDYDLVINNFGWRAAPWPVETQQALEKYMRQGGGLVIVHAANNSFPEWDAYNEMIGLGGWGGRNEASGPYIYLDKDLKMQRDLSEGRGGSHGPRHEYQIVIRNDDHPITKGLPSTWLHSSDELYQQLRGPAENLTVLATAYADPKFGGLDRHEPMLMTIKYGQGRVFHTTMGHDDVSFECVGFITTLLRGAEWVATGEVSLTEVPQDFPKPLEISRRPSEL